jgi:hypothetical protein
MKPIQFPRADKPCVGELDGEQDCSINGSGLAVDGAGAGLGAEIDDECVPDDSTGFDVLK